MQNDLSALRPAVRRSGSRGNAPLLQLHALGWQTLLCQSPCASSATPESRNEQALGPSSPSLITHSSAGLHVHAMPQQTLHADLNILQIRFHDHPATPLSKSILAWCFVSSHDSSRGGAKQIQMQMARSTLTATTASGQLDLPVSSQMPKTLDAWPDQSFSADFDQSRRLQAKGNDLSN